MTFYLCISPLLPFQASQFFAGEDVGVALCIVGCFSTLTLYTLEANSEPLVMTISTDYKYCQTSPGRENHTWPRSRYSQRDAIQPYICTYTIQLNIYSIKEYFVQNVNYTLSSIPEYAMIYYNYRNNLKELDFLSWQPNPVLLPWKSHGRRSLVGYSPWGRKESDTAEWLHFHFHFSLILYSQHHLS